MQTVCSVFPSLIFSLTVFSIICLSDTWRVIFNNEKWGNVKGRAADEGSLSSLCFLSVVIKLKNVRCSAHVMGWGFNLREGLLVTWCSFRFHLLTSRLRTQCIWVNLMPHGNFSKEATTLYQYVIRNRRRMEKRRHEELKNKDVWIRKGEGGGQEEELVAGNAYLPGDK